MSLKSLYETTDDEFNEELANLEKAQEMNELNILTTTKSTKYETRNNNTNFVSDDEDDDQSWIDDENKEKYSSSEDDDFDEQKDEEDDNMLGLEHIVIKNDKDDKEKKIQSKDRYKKRKRSQTSDDEDDDDDENDDCDNTNKSNDDSDDDKKTKKNHKSKKSSKKRASKKQKIDKHKSKNKSKHKSDSDSKSKSNSNSKQKTKKSVSKNAIDKIPKFENHSILVSSYYGFVTKIDSKHVRIMDDYADNIIFYRVWRTNAKSKSLRVMLLKHKTVEVEKTNPLGEKFKVEIVTPVINDNDVELLTLHWYSSCMAYSTRENHASIRNSYKTFKIKTEVYDKDNIYYVLVPKEVNSA